MHNVAGIRHLGPPKIESYTELNDAIGKPMTDRARLDIIATHFKLRLGKSGKPTLGAMKKLCRGLPRDNPGAQRLRERIERSGYCERATLAKI